MTRTRVPEGMRVAVDTALAHSEKGFLLSSRLSVISFMQAR